MSSAAVEIARAVAPVLGVTEVEAAAMVEVARRPELGDYAVPCFAAAKRLRKAPPAIAREVASAFRPGDLIREAVADGPYVNFRVDRARLAAEAVGNAVAQGPAYGTSQDGAGQTVVVDYSSPNIAKPFHIGHLRSTVIGGALVRIFRALGHPVVGVNHLGDWGTQFGLLGAYLDDSPMTGTDLRALVDAYVAANRRAEDDPEFQEAARAWFRALEAGDPARRRIWASMRETSLSAFDRIYARLGVSFDDVRGESFYEDRLAPTVQAVDRAGVLERSEGALIVRIPDMEEPCLLRKSDGATLYATRDLAAALYRWEEFRFWRCIYVVGTPQTLHFRQVFGTIERMGCEWADRMVHVDFGHYLGMRTRKGEVVFLEDVLDEAVERARETMRAGDRVKVVPEEWDHVAEKVGVGAVVFNDLANRRSRDIQFDWGRVLTFDGETGPYLQYTHARLSSILRRVEAETGERPGPGFDAALLADERLWPAVSRVAGYPEALRAAARDYEPSLVSRHLLDAAQAWNRIENLPDLKVKDADPARRRALVALVAGVKQVLQSGLAILGVEPLERM